MKLRKVISGGQTGADRMGLECAKALGLETGGSVPKGCRTDVGPAPELISEFNCVEHESPYYPPRTEVNVINSDVTLLFGNMLSPGCTLTIKLCLKHNKPFAANPKDLLPYAKLYEVFNIAGNRQSTNPRAAILVKQAFNTLFDHRSPKDGR